MMEKKLCLTLIVFFIDFTYAAKISIKNDDQSIDDNSLMPSLICGSNETLNTIEKVCEPICDLQTPSLQCVEKAAPSCSCLDNYVRNVLNQCILLTECSNDNLSKSDLIIKTNLQLSQHASLQENKNTTLFDSNNIVPKLVEHLTLQLEHFLRSLNNRMKKNPGRNVRQTNITNSTDDNSYRAYEILLRQSNL